MKKTKTQNILELVRQKGVVRPKDLDEFQIPRIYLQRLKDKGLLYRVARGLYSITNAEVSEYHTLVEASKRVPNGVICLLSALQYHGITTQNPSKVWMAIRQKAWRSQIERPSIRFFHYSDLAYKTGISEYKIESSIVKIYNPAKTIIDCFKYRNKIGLDIAIEALKDGYQQRKCSINELWQYAEICRVKKVIKPYLESII